MTDSTDPQTSPGTLESPSTHCGDGSEREEFSLSAHEVTIADSSKGPLRTQSLLRLAPVAPPDNGMPTAGSARPSKRTTSSGKSNRPKKRTRTTPSSRTSARASTSKEKDCYGWWNKSCEEMSKRLWFPTRTDFAGSHSNSSNGFVESTTRHSWSRIKKYAPRNRNFPKTSWPSSTSSRVGTTACDDTGPLVRVQKIRIHPSTQQAQILRTWMKAARDTYNLALRLVKDGKAKPNLLLKKLVVTRRATDSKKMSKMKESPADIRVRAVLDLIDAFKTAEAGHKARLQRQKTQKSRWAKKHTKNNKGKHKKTKARKHKNTKNAKGKNNRGRRGRRRWRKNVAYHMNYKSKRCTADSFGFEKKSVQVDNKKKQLLLFSAHRKFGMTDGIKMSEAAQHKVTTCCRLQYHFGRWYFLLVYKQQNDAPGPSSTGPRIGALDPGVRTFQSYYSDDEAGEIGTQEELERVFRPIDKKIKRLQEHIQKEKDPKRGRRLRKAWYRANARSSDLATDFHYKTIKFLLNRFDVIIAPKLNTASMLHGDSQLRKKTKEQMRFYRHGIFHRRLLEKASIAQKVILDLEEHGTSMTCSACGVANRKLGSSKTFCCKHCKFKSDRDINSARNHILKALVGNEKY